MSRYIDADKLVAWCQETGRAQSTVTGKAYVSALLTAVDSCPTADVVEVRHDFDVGDFCLYGFEDENKSLAIVEIVKILDDERGIAEVGFLKVIRDNTGNGFFNYLFNKGGTMNASFKYLQNITPKSDGERREQKSARKCVNCRHNIRIKMPNGNIECRCEIMNARIGYVACFEHWCKHWAKDERSENGT